MKKTKLLIISEQEDVFEVYKLLLNEYFISIEILHIKNNDFIEEIDFSKFYIVLIDLSSNEYFPILNKLSKMDQKDNKIILITPYDLNQDAQNIRNILFFNLILIKPFEVLRLENFIKNESENIERRNILERNNKILAKVVDLNPAKIAVYKLNGTMFYANSSYLKANNLKYDNFENLDFDKISHCDIAFLSVKEKLKTTNSFVTQKEENEKWLESTFYMISDEFIIHNCVDITLQKQKELQLEQSAIFFENSNEGILITDANRKIISVNKAFSKITGYEKEEVLGKTPSILSSGVHDKEFYKNMRESLTLNSTWKGEIWNKKKNGEIYPEWLNISIVKDSSGNILNYVAIFSDITKIKKSNERIEYLAHHDPLTNLPNRLLLKARLDQSITRASISKEILALFFIDIDNFKVINDTYGHSIGDKIINLVASRLQKNLRAEDTISRIGGDEFVIVIENIDQERSVEKIANKILDDFKEPIKLQEYLFDVTISIGISLFPNNSHDAEDLIKHADTAMYSAKNAGRNQFQFYKNEMTSEIFEKIIMKKEISDALKNGDFEVYYQAQINIKENKIVGLEALVRWNYRNGRLILPNEFIAYAEETKLILPLGEFVLKSACNFIKKLQNMNLAQGAIVAVNISSIQIKNCDIFDLILNSLKNSNLDAKYLEVELTESYIMENTEQSLLTLNKLKDLGIKLAIDDFGTGYSSLSYLKKFPIDKLKIDKSFVNELPNNPKDVAIARTIIALAKGLEMKTIAEGVELQKQKDFLEQEECDEIQGWLYGKALRENDFIEFAKNFK